MKTRHEDLKKAMAMKTIRLHYKNFKDIPTVLKKLEELILTKEVIIDAITPDYLAIKGRQCFLDYICTIY